MKIGNLELDRIYCMDCIEGMKQIPDNSIDLILTDPPYDVDYDKKSKHLSALFQARKKQIERDKAYQALDTPYDLFCKEIYRILKENTHCYIFCGDKQLPIWYYETKNVGFKFGNILIWLKNRQTFDLSCGYNYNYRFEPCLYLRKGTRKLNSLGLNNLLKYDTGKSLIHPTQKPIKLFEFLIKNSSNKKEIIFDPFIGSGTTAVACKRLNRHFIGFEISPDYCKIAEQRLRNVPKRLDYFNIDNLDKNERSV